MATVVFDLDGTLVDSAPDLAAALNHVLAGEGLPTLPLARVRSLVGAGAVAMLRRGFEVAGEPLGAARLPPLRLRFLDHYRAGIARRTRPFPGALAALDALAGAGHALALCSNKPEAMCRALLDALDLSARFASVIGGDSVGIGKPDPAPLRAAVERAGGNVTEAVMIGDSAPDVGAARALGIPVCLVSFGYTDIPAGELGADAVIDHFRELSEALGALAFA